MTLILKINQEDRKMNDGYYKYVIRMNNKKLAECEHIKADPTKEKYSEKYDAYYCEECNEWTEPKCNSDNCEFCPSRPDKPKSVTKC